MPMYTLNKNGPEQFLFDAKGGTGLDGLNRSSGGGFSQQTRWGQKPLQYFTGQPLEQITLNGTWVGLKGMQELDRLREIQRQGEPMELSNAEGFTLGRWVVSRLTENHQHLLGNGLAITQGWTLELTEYVE